jgi:putative copper export protein
VTLTWVDGLALALRAGALVGTLQAVGAALFAWRHTARLERAAEPAARFAARSAWLAAGLTVLQQLCEPARLAGSLAGIVDPALQALWLGSPAGAASAARVTGLVLLASGTKRTLLVVSGTALVVASFTFMGHTATHEPRPLLAALLAAHVAVAAFWLGALRPLALVVTQERSAVAGRVLERFSRHATLLVPLILVAGATLAALLLPSVASLAEPFGLTLLAKTALYGTLLALAALNKWRLVPRVANGDAAGRRALLRSVRAEWWIIVAVSCLTTALTGVFSPHD